MVGPAKKNLDQPKTFWDLFEQMCVFIKTLICANTNKTTLHFTYYKVTNSRLFWLVAHLRIFRVFTKGKFDVYVPDLWPKEFKIR